ncbi:MAG: (2Fe-2S)-binding protein, partial [bacterium]|nr:(2Fe-2S)-binding protein [bacterium]
LELDEWERLWKQDPDYGEIVCRCEKVTRAEVKRALDNPLEVRTLLGLKLRTRVTAGRCQGGFCMLRVVGSLEKTTGAATSATLSGDGSSLFTGRTKSLHMDKVRSEKTES